MKNGLTWMILWLLSSFLLAQEKNNEDILGRLQALKQDNRQYFQLGNYSIYAESFNQSFTTKNIEKLKRKLSITAKSQVYKADWLQEDNLVFRASKTINTQLKQEHTYYFIKQGEQKLEVIEFSSVNYSDTLIEREFIILKMSEKIPLSIFSPDVPQMIDFAGRNLDLSIPCHWESVGNLQCPYCGQMNWAIHENTTTAETAVNVQFQLTTNRNLVKIVADEPINITFEGLKTKVRRAKLKIRVPKIVLGGVNELIVYYVVAEVRGKIISCVLSHYTDDKIAELELPPLLNKVMKLSK
jgi:hypothetical protein